MTTWTSQLTAQLGNYTPILSTITQVDGECLQSIYDTLVNHALDCNTTLLDYVNQGICVALNINETVIKTPFIATLKVIGIVLTNDNKHIGLTPLGYGFMQTMLNI